MPDAPSSSPSEARDPSAGGASPPVAPVAPVDPRTDLPGFGDLPVVTSLSPSLVRVIVANPSPLTLDGTNTYVVGDPGSGAALLVDPGPWRVDIAPQVAQDHLHRVAEVVRQRDAEVAGIVVTHHHDDHSEAAQHWAEHFGCRVIAATRDVAGPDGTLVGDGEAFGPGGARLQVVATPGHCADHLAFRLADGGLLVGDHVLGRGTSVVAHPDGDLLAYLDSLRKVLDLGVEALHPGHGPALLEDPSAVVAYYLHHRAFREQQVLDVLALGPATPAAIVEVIYAAYDRSVWTAAEASTRATLAKLTAQGRVDWRADTARLVPGDDPAVTQSASLGNEPSDRSAPGTRGAPTGSQEDRR